MKLDLLTRPDEPWLHLLSVRDVAAAVSELNDNLPPSFVVRTLRGRKAPTVASLFDECAAALQFPLHFGENWDALHDCLTDLTWLPGAGYVLVIADAVRLLEHSPAEEQGRLVSVLNAAAAYWNQAEQPRSPKPFHVLFHAGPREITAVRKRWEAAGAEMHRLP